MLKRCGYCDNLFPENDFGVAVTVTGKTYRRNKCRYCYRKTKKALIAKQRQWIAEYKSQRGCAKCGIDDFRVLDFHHSEDEEKNFNTSDFRYKVGFEKLRREIEKCSLLCANCHRIVHYKTAY